MEGSQIKEKEKKRRLKKGERSPRKRRRKYREEHGKFPDIRAKLSYLRMSPRKVRLVADLIRGKSVEEAQNLLRFSPKAAARPMLKLLNSAVANAKEAEGYIDEANLYVDKVLVDGGPILYRFRARAMGRAARIRKRTSHITIVLKEKE